MGTVLASSCDDGVVRLWKMDFRGKWLCVTRVQGRGGEAAAEEGATPEAAGGLRVRPVPGT